MMLLKKLLYALLCACQIHHIFRYINREKVVVLAYHGVVESRPSFPLWGQLEYKRFKEQVDHICRFYNVISIDWLADYLNGNRNLPNNSVLITFDDGYRNNYEVAYPLLLQKNIPATIFITTNFLTSGELLWFDQIAVSLHSYRGPLPIPFLNLDISITDENRGDQIEMLIQKCKTLDPMKRQNLLDNLKKLPDDKLPVNSKLQEILEPIRLDQVKELDRSPLITIGAHTADHEILTKCSLEEAESQILQSKKTLEKILEKPVHSFAYPNGKREDFNSNTQALLKKSGFNLAFTTVRRLVELDTSRYEIGRFCIGNDLSSFKPLFYLTLAGFIDNLKRCIRLKKDGI